LTLTNEFVSFALCSASIRFLIWGGSVNSKSGSPISRREFARRAAIASAVALAPPGASTMYSAVGRPLPQQPSEIPSLSPEGQAESEARYQAILARYGSRFSDSQKSELRRLSFLAQSPLDHLRAYPIENGEGSALYLKPLVEREKNPEHATVSHQSTEPAKKR